MAYLEEQNNTQVVLNKTYKPNMLINETNAANIDYSKRYPTFY
jgi:hypothetical protein